MSQVKERPILMSPPMVVPTLADLKTNTRRVMKKQPSDYVPGPNIRAPRHSGPYFDAYCGEVRTAKNPRGMGPYWCWWTPDDRVGDDKIKCPYGVPGDRLWVKETACIAPKNWATPDDTCLKDYEGDLRYVSYKADGHDEEAMRGYGLKWTPSIFMPRWASRITLEITDIRVERLQDISPEDAIAEGIEPGPFGDRWENYDRSSPIEFVSPIDSFASLWVLINGEIAWKANPWVWVIAFKRIEVAS